MGFMGLDSWNSSDGAADFRYTVLEAIAEECEKEILDEANCYNTPGWVNIALVAEDLLVGVSLYSDDRLYIILDKARKKLKEDLDRIEKEKGWDSKGMHIKGYKRMIKSLDKILTLK